MGVVRVLIFLRRDIVETDSIDFY